MKTKLLWVTTECSIFNGFVSSQYEWQQKLQELATWLGHFGVSVNYPNVQDLKAHIRAKTEEFDQISN